MADAPFTRYRNQRVTITPVGLELDSRTFGPDESLDFGGQVGAVPACELARAAEAHLRLTGGECPAQLAALAYAAGVMRALDWYFPLTSALDDAEVADFYRLVVALVQHPHVDVRLMGAASAPLPADSHAIVAGHLAEIFFRRRDILDRFLSAPRHFRLYATWQAFEQD